MKLRVIDYEEDPIEIDRNASPANNETDAIEWLLTTTTTQLATPPEGEEPFPPVNFKAENLSTSKNQAIFYNFVHRPRGLLKQLFLPIGYPHSVADPESYLWYQFYDSLQGLCSYLRGVVSTSAVLESAGVGSSDVTALSAAMAWAARDGMGMMGGLCFSFFASDLFDSHVKEFRLFADVINDVGLTLDMIAPYVATDFGREYTIYLLSLSTICKTMCGMSAGATKGRITQHFSTQNGNMADLTAKESTQETLVSLLGMIGGMSLAKFLSSFENTDQSRYQELVTWAIFLTLTVVHVWANYKGVTLLKLRSLNQERCRGIFKDLIHRLGEKQGDGGPSISKAVSNLPTPSKVDESLLASVSALIKPNICFGNKFNPQIFSFISCFSDCKYLVGRKHTRRGRKSLLFVTMKVEATKEDELMAFLHAHLLYRKLTHDTSQQWSADLIQR